MSRIGKKPIEIPQGVIIRRDNDRLHAEGPKGNLSVVIPRGIGLVLGDKQVTVEVLSNDRKERACFGLARTLIDNMVTGVSKGFEKGLEISGVGYRAEINKNILKMVLGYSSPVEYVVPEGIAVKVEKLVNILVSGIDRQLVGQVASEIRSLKKPEPYKGKGIKYVGEQIRRKVGKSVGA